MDRNLITRTLLAGVSGLCLFGGDAAGFRALVNSSGLTIHANGSEMAYSVGGANDGSETWAWGYDNSNPAAPVAYIKRRTAGGSVQTFGPFTLTSLIPTNPTVFVGANGTGAGGA